MRESAGPVTVIKRRVFETSPKGAMNSRWLEKVKAECGRHVHYKGRKVRRMNLLW